MKKNETKEMLEKIKLAIDNSITMAEANGKIGLHINTFIRIAKKYGWYKPNQGAKGRLKPKKEGVGKIPLVEILQGKHPSYQTFKLKKRLIKLGYKYNQCEECGISEWNNKPIQCELDHIDGNSQNHLINNLKMLCPNCHSQTNTFRAKNIKV
jgi:hypothetical protein